MTDVRKRRRPARQRGGRTGRPRLARRGLGRRLRRAILLLLLGAALAYPGAFLADALLAALQ